MEKNGFEVFEVAGSAEIEEYKTEEGENIRVDENKE